MKSVAGDANVGVQLLAKLEGSGSVVSRVVEADVDAVTLVAAVDGDVGGAVVFHACSMAGSAGFCKGADRPVWSVYRTSGILKSTVTGLNENGTEAKSAIVIRGNIEVL